MGAISRTFTFNFCASREELLKRWDRQQGEDVWDKGHGAYQGTIAHARLSISPRRFETLQAASNHADGELDHMSKGTAVAFYYGDGVPVFPATAKDRELVATVDKLTAELDNFELDILRRFVQSKSASKRCTHCDSVISKKSRERLVHGTYLARVNQLRDLRDALEEKRERTSCPACWNNLLTTDTDLKRRKSLEERLALVTDKLEAARKAFYAKSKPYGYYVAGMVPY